MTDNRRRALELAAGIYVTHTPDVIVSAAEEFLAFLSAEDFESDAETPVAHTVEPGVKKRRSSKKVAEEAAKVQVVEDAAKVQVDAPAQQTVEASAPVQTAVVEKDVPKAVEYRDLQRAVLTLIQVKGKEPAVEVLRQLNVATALGLHPDQYAAALELFTAALAA